MKRNIPIKNYIILFVVFIATVLVTIFLSVTYKSSVRVEENDNFRIIKTIELDNYVVDTPNTLIYVSNEMYGKDLKLYDFIYEKEIQHDVVYADVNKDDEEFKKFVEQRFYDKNINFNYNDFIPGLLVVENGKIVDVLKSNDTLFDIYRVEQLLLKHGYIEEND